MYPEQSVTYVPGQKKPYNQSLQRTGTAACGAGSSRWAWAL